MQTRATHNAVRAGWAGVVAGPLMALSVGIELVVDIQRPDGTPTRPVLFAVLLALWALGTACMTATVHGLRQVHSDLGRPLPRVGRVGARVMLAGCLLLLAFPVLSGATAAASGKPADVVFLPFGIGFLCLIAGSVMLGRGVHRAGPIRPAAVPLWLGAVFAFSAIAVPTDPWHDLALFAFLATWTALGLLLLRHAARSTADSPAREELSV